MTRVLDTAMLIDRLNRFPAALQAVARVVAPADASWRPDETSWSVVEVVAHLADEEVEDFYARCRSTIEDPARAWPPIDPVGVAIERDYRSRDLTGELNRFAESRAESVAWLRSLGPDAPWHHAYEHPTIGPIRAGDLLSSWADHDALHLRQIAKRLHQLAQRDAGDHTTLYAGEW